MTSSPITSWQIDGGKVETVTDFIFLGSKITDFAQKTLMLGKIEKEKGVAEDTTVRQHNRLNGHEFEPTPGDSEGQGSLACCSLRGHSQTQLSG